MKIRAILLGCEGIDDEYLAGVHKDIDSMQQYLLSTSGGQWNNDEIKLLKTSSKSDVLSAINQAKFENNDFILFFFAGHGSYNDLIGRKFYINKTEYITRDDLKNLANKQINIFDTCASRETSIVEKFEFGVEGRILDSIQHHREKYLQKIQECPNQTINVFSCGEDETSGESSKGGFFTQSLISESTKSQVDLSVIEAFALAEDKVRIRTNRKQNPEYETQTRSGKKLPFKVT